MRDRTFGHHFGPWMAPFPGHFAFDFDPRGRGGRGGRGRGRRNRGDVRAALLALLSERPMHGYEMIQELDERTGGIWRPSPGSVYPTLQLLEDEGLITSEAERGPQAVHAHRRRPRGSGEGDGDPTLGSVRRRRHAVDGVRVPQGVVRRHERGRPGRVLGIRRAARPSSRGARRDPPQALRHPRRGRRGVAACQRAHGRRGRASHPSGASAFNRARRACWPGVGRATLRAMPCVFRYRRRVGAVGEWQAEGHRHRDPSASGCGDHSGVVRCRRSWGRPRTRVGRGRPGSARRACRNHRGCSPGREPREPGARHR